MFKHVLTLGTFDLFHTGHVAFLKTCADIGRVTVALNTDKYAGEFKYKPICSLEERMEVIQALRAVNCVRVNDGDCSKVIKQWARDVFRRHEPKFLVIGVDWMPTEYYLAQLGITLAFLKQLNVTLLFVGEQHTLHTSEIKERCQKRQSL